jgi:hypothetical protein
MEQTRMPRIRTACMHICISTAKKSQMSSSDRFAPPGATRFARQQRKTAHARTTPSSTLAPSPSCLLRLSAPWPRHFLPFLRGVEPSSWADPAPAIFYVLLPMDPTPVESSGQYVNSPPRWSHPAIAWFFPSRALRTADCKKEAHPVTVNSDPIRHRRRRPCPLAPPLPSPSCRRRPPPVRHPRPR